MRLEDLAARLVAVEAKLATLTGTSVNTDSATSIEDLDARLSVVEAQVDQLIAEKTQRHIEEIISASAATAPIAVEDVVALSPSAEVPEAAAIIADVIAEQHEAEPIVDTQVSDVIAAAVAAIVTAEPEIVTDPVALTAAIVEAVSDAPAPAPEVVEQIVVAVVDIIATATNVEVVAPEVVQQVAEAVTTPADPALDAIEARIDIVEAKVDSLLGK
jgi:tetrahydromethanopterin S-methyltransferase subunit G